jgi:hypothetical protein
LVAGPCKAVLTVVMLKREISIENIYLSRIKFAIS